MSETKTMSSTKTTSTERVGLLEGCEFVIILSNESESGGI